MSPWTRAARCSSTPVLARMLPLTSPSTMTVPQAISASILARSPTMRTSSVTIEPLNFASIRTVPLNVSLPSNSTPAPSRRSVALPALVERSSRFVVDMGGLPAEQAVLGTPRANLAGPNADGAALHPAVTARTPGPRARRSTSLPDAARARGRYPRSVPEDGGDRRRAGHPVGWDLDHVSSAQEDHLADVVQHVGVLGVPLPIVNVAPAGRGIDVTPQVHPLGVEDQPDTTSRRRASDDGQRVAGSPRHERGTVLRQ